MTSNFDEDVSNTLMFDEEIELSFANQEVVTSDDLRQIALEFFTEEQVAQYEGLEEQYGEIQVGTISSPASASSSSTPEIHHYHHHPMNTFDQTIALFLAGMCAGMVYMNKCKNGKSKSFSRTKSGYL